MTGELIKSTGNSHYNACELPMQSVLSESPDLNPPLDRHPAPEPQTSRSPESPRTGQRVSSNNMTSLNPPWTLGHDLQALGAEP